MSRVRMAEEGMAIGLVVALILMAGLATDDFSLVFWPAGRMSDPYASELYYYPVWNTWVLRGVALLPRVVGLALVGAFNVIVVLACSPVWETPGWLVFIAPPFFFGFLSGHPFEAVVFAGVSLACVGWRRRKAGLMGLGLALCLFKLQLGLLPALVVVYWISGSRESRWLAWAIPIGMIVATTLLDWGLYGQLWLGPWWGAVQRVPEVVWNVSPVRVFGVFSAVWIPIGLWFGYNVQDFQRRVWLAMAVSLLISPYWGGYSLWPLLAMAGCWRGRREEYPICKPALPCDSCEHKRGENFCKFLPWNDEALETPLEKYIAWQGKPCPYSGGDEPAQKLLQVGRREAHV